MWNWNSFCSVVWIFALSFNFFALTEKQTYQTYIETRSSALFKVFQWWRSNFTAAWIYLENTLILRSNLRNKSFQVRNRSVGQKPRSAEYLQQFYQWENRVGELRRRQSKEMGSSKLGCNAWRGKSFQSSSLLFFHFTIDQYRIAGGNPKHSYQCGIIYLQWIDILQIQVQAIIGV